MSLFQFIVPGAFRLRRDEPRPLPPLPLPPLLLPPPLPPLLPPLPLPLPPETGATPVFCSVVMFGGGVAELDVVVVEVDVVEEAGGVPPEGVEGGPEVSAIDTVSFHRAVRIVPAGQAGSLTYCRRYARCLTICVAPPRVKTSAARGTARG